MPLNKDIVGPAILWDLCPARCVQGGPVAFDPIENAETEVLTRCFAFGKVDSLDLKKHPMLTAKHLECAPAVDELLMALGGQGVESLPWGQGTKAYYHNGAWDTLVTVSLSSLVLKAEDWLATPTLSLLPVLLGKTPKKLQVYYLELQMAITYEFTDAQWQYAAEAGAQYEEYLDQRFQEQDSPIAKINPHCPSCPFRASCPEFQATLSSSDTDLETWLQKAQAIGLDDIDTRIGVMNARNILTARMAIFEKLRRGVDAVLLDYASKHGGVISAPEVGMGFSVVQQFSDSILSESGLEASLRAAGVWDDSFKALSLSVIKKKLSDKQWAQVANIHVLHKPNAPYLKQAVVKVGA